MIREARAGPGFWKPGKGVRGKDRRVKNLCVIIGQRGPVLEKDAVFEELETLIGTEEIGRASCRERV
jgi:hypothetical protein